MRAVFGLLLIMLGLAMAVVWMPEHDGQRHLAAVTDIATQGIVARPHEIPRPVARTFSPQTPLISAADQAGAIAARHTAATARVSLSAPGEGGVPGASLAPATVIVPVVATPGSAAPAIPQARSLVPEMPREELIRNLQRELRRIGCYAGEIDGDWGTGSRRAMTSANERLNASLPVDHPDPVFLHLLMGQTAALCGRGCPPGQALVDGNRCVANAVLAQRRSADRRETAALPTPTAPVVSGGDTGWTSRMARTTTTEGVTVDTASAAAAGALAAAVPPMPGRLAMGAGAQDIGAPQGSPQLGNALNAARRAVRPELQAPDFAPAPRPSRRAQRGPRGRGHGAPVVVYRAPRVYAPSYYASAPRRTGRNWTATFFGNY